MAPVYAALKQSGGLKPCLISTGQHRHMLDQTFGVFGLTPDIELNVMQPGQGLPDLTARIVTAMNSDAARPAAGRHFAAGRHHHRSRVRARGLL